MGRPGSKSTTDLRDSMSQLLTSAEIDMLAFQIAPFETTTSRDHHKGLVERVERIEQATLSKLTNFYGQEVILNKKVQAGQVDAESSKVADEVLATVESELRI